MLSTAATTIMAIYSKTDLGALRLLSGREVEVFKSLESTETQDINSSVEFSDMPHLSLLRNFVILSFPKLSFILFHYLISFVAQIRI